MPRRIAISVIRPRATNERPKPVRPVIARKTLIWADSGHFVATVMRLPSGRTEPSITRVSRGLTWWARMEKPVAMTVIWARVRRPHPNSIQIAPLAISLRTITKAVLGETAKAVIRLRIGPKLYSIIGGMLDSRCRVATDRWIARNATTGCWGANRYRRRVSDATRRTISTLANLGTNATLVIRPTHGLEIFLLTTIWRGFRFSECTRWRPARTVTQIRAFATPRQSVSTATGKTIFTRAHWGPRAKSVTIPMPGMRGALTMTVGLLFRLRANTRGSNAELAIPRACPEVRISLLAAMPVIHWTTPTEAVSDPAARRVTSNVRGTKSGRRAED